MGVDNSGVILLGHKGDTESLRALLSQEQRDVIGEQDLADWLYFTTPFQSALLLDWQLSEPVGYESSGLAGFNIDSPSYGIKSMKLSDFLADVNFIAKLWRECFGNDPELFVLNLQH